VHIHTAEQYERPHEDDMIDRILELLEGAEYKANVFVDAINISFIRKLKSKVKKHGKQTDIDWHLDYLRRNNLAGKNDSELPRYMIVVPVSFAKHGPRLLQIASIYIQRRWPAIHPNSQS
jgi:hypothetical protein